MALSNMKKIPLSSMNKMALSNMKKTPLSNMKKMTLLNNATYGSRTPSTVSELGWRAESLLAFMLQFHEYTKDELEKLVKTIANDDIYLKTAWRICANGELTGYIKKCLIDKFKNISLKENSDNHIIIVFEGGDFIDSAEIEGTRKDEDDTWDFRLLSIVSNSTKSKSYSLTNVNYDYLSEVINREIYAGNVKSGWEWRMYLEAQSVLNMLIPLAKKSAQEIKWNLERIHGLAWVVAVFCEDISEGMWKEEFKRASVTIDNDNHITAILEDGASISYVKVEGVRHNEIWHFKLLNITQGEDM